MSIRLLVSVRNVAEARVAVAEGVSILDVKEPAHGPLGMADPYEIRQIATTLEEANTHTNLQVQVTGKSTQLSVACGELSEWRGRAAVQLPAGVTFVKLGLAGTRNHPNWRDEWRRVMSQFCSDQFAQAILVAYVDADRADSPGVRDVVDFAAHVNCAGVLFDTYDKRQGRLWNHLSPAECLECLQELRRASRLSALAGSLKIADVSIVNELRPDIMGVRSAACRHQDRQQALDAGALRDLQTALANAG